MNLQLMSQKQSMNLQFDLHPISARLCLIVLSLSFADLSPLNAENVEVNEFGNAVFPVQTVSSLLGTPPIADSGSSQGNVDEIRLDSLIDLTVTLDILSGHVEDAIENPGADDDLAELNRVDQALFRLEQLLDSKVVGVRKTSSFSHTEVNTALINAPDFDVIETAIRGLDPSGIIQSKVTSSSVAAAIRTVADTDPFVTMSGAITNLSETDTISVFLPFENAFFKPFSLDTPLSRQALVSTHIQDANRDGQAALREASIHFSFLATEDPSEPTSSNTKSIGFTETLGVFGISENRLVRRVGPVEPIDQAFIDRVSNDASFSHLLGEVRLLGITPGDTVTFRAIVSVGDQNDPQLPLLDVEDLDAMLSAIEIFGQRQIPEPSGHAFIVTLLCCLPWLRGQIAAI